MHTVYKYAFSISDRFALEMPEGATLLRVDSQGKQACLWALVDTSRAIEGRLFRLFGTGHTIPEEEIPFLTYVGTWFDAPFVWHLFEIDRKNPSLDTRRP